MGSKASRLAKTVFWTNAAASAWTLAGYPLLLALLPRRGWQKAKTEITASVIVPAFREREALGRKLSVLGDPALDEAIAEVIVVVDDDPETLEIAQAAAPWARFFFRPTRQGKLSALAQGAAVAEGEVLVLTDANNIVTPAAIKAGLESFADDSVSGVTGQRYEPGSAYEHYEALVRRLEARSGSVAAVSGELFLVRAVDFPVQPDEPPVNEDLWLLCRLVEAGGRVVFEPLARSNEDQDELRGEIERRTRMMAGLAAQLGELGRVPRPLATRLASHKFARLALPGNLLALLGASAALRTRSPYREVFWAEVLMLLVASASLVVKDAPEPLGTPVRAARQLLVGNLATVRGLARAIGPGQSAVWESVR